MFNVGGGEIIVVLLIALMVLGPDKLPGAARQVGKYLNEFRRISSGFQDEIRSAMDVVNQTPVDLPPAEPDATATTPATPSESTSSDSTTPEPKDPAVTEPTTPEMPATMWPEGAAPDFGDATPTPA